MTLIAVLALMMASFGTVAWPFLGPRMRRDERAKGLQPWDDLMSQRDTAYQALKELEFEYNLGNLSDADYNDLRDRYRSQAATILQKLDTEIDISRPEDLPTSIAPQTPLGGCASCGETIESGDTYCWRCGQRLDRRCQDCGEPLLEADRFCAGCGRSLEAEP